MKLTRKRMEGIDTSKYNVKQLASMMLCNQKAVWAFLKRHNLPYVKRQSPILTESIKNTILANKGKPTNQIARMIGLPRYHINNFLGYLNRKEKKSQSKFFTWDDYPNGIY